MTCIAAIAQTGHVTLGCDSAVSYMGARILRANSKVVHTDQYVMGFSGVARSLDIILYGFEPPKIEGNVSGRQLDAFMANQFSEALRETLNKFGALGKDKDSDMPSLSDGGRMIVGVLGQIYFIDCVMSCHRVADPFFAVGSGGDLALGSLATSLREPVTSRLRKALECAARFSETVCAPFMFVSTDPEISRQLSG